MLKKKGYKRMDEKKTNGKVEQKPVRKSHDENYIIPLLIRIDKNLRELVTMKRESMALYHYKKAHNRWF